MLPLWGTQNRADLATEYSAGDRVPVVCNWISPPGVLAPDDDEIELRLSDIGQVFFPWNERDTAESEYAGRPIVQEYIQFEIELRRDISANEVRDILQSRIGAVDAAVLLPSELSYAPEPIKDIRESDPMPSEFGAGMTTSLVLTAIIAAAAVFLVLRYSR